jgi:hypothetical protein
MKVLIDRYTNVPDDAPFEAILETADVSIWRLQGLPDI